MERIGTSTNIFFERNDGSRIPAERTMRLCAQAGYRDMDFGFVEQIFYPTPLPRRDGALLWSAICAWQKSWGSVLPRPMAISMISAMTRRKRSGTW